MAPHRIDLIAILHPKEGKVDRMLELLTELTAYVEANEPGTQRYLAHREVNKKTGVEDVIMLESYADTDAQKTHVASDAFKAFVQKIKDEDLMGAEMELKYVKPVGGYSRL